MSHVDILYAQLQKRAVDPIFIERSMNALWMLSMVKEEESMSLYIKPMVQMTLTKEEKMKAQT